MWLAGIVKLANKFAPLPVAVPPVLLTDPNQTAVIGVPFVLLLETNEPCDGVVIGEEDASGFDIGTDAVGAVAFSVARAYNLAVRLTSKSSGLFIDVPITITAVASASEIETDFGLSPATISASAAIGTVVGTLSVTATGERPADFELSPSTIPVTATVGTVVGTFS